MFPSTVFPHRSPQSVAHFSDKFDPSNYLPIDERSYRSFANALAGVLCEDEGVLVVHVGRQEGHHRLEDGPADSLVSRHYQNELLAHFSKNFQTAREYEQGDDRFLIAFRDRASTVFWNLGQDHVDLELAKRALPAASGLWPFRSFDGATMMQYQSPSRLVEDVYCRSRPQPPLCSAKHGMDPEIDNVPITSLHVRQSQIPNGGRGLFFTEAVPKGTYIAAEELVNGIFMSPLATEYSNEMEKYLPGHPYFEAIGAYAFAYGFANDFFGDTGFSIEPSRLCFINHGCNGTFVQGAQLSVTEMTADLEEYPDELANSIAETSFFSPFADRSMFTLMHINEVTLRDVNAGEELLDNYLAYYTEENWHCAVADVRAQCSNQAIGMVDRYQHAHDHDYDDVDNE